MYTVTLDRQAKKTLKKLFEPDLSKIKAAILSLGSNPRPHGYKKLKNRPGFRIRKGDYRIIYHIIDHLLIVNVIALGHRRYIYD